MTDTKLLPLPEYLYGREASDNERVVTVADAHAYAIRNVAHHTAAKDAEIAQLEKANEQLHAHGERMHAEIEALRKERDRAVEAGEIMARHLDTLEPRAERLAGLLDEVRSHFTRDDDLPDDLLPRIDAALAAQQVGES